VSVYEGRLEQREDWRRLMVPYEVRYSSYEQAKVGKVYKVIR